MVSLAGIAVVIVIVIWNSGLFVVNRVRRMRHQGPWGHQSGDYNAEFLGLVNRYLPMYTAVWLVLMAWVGHAGGFAQAIQGL